MSSIIYMFINKIFGLIFRGNEEVMNVVSYLGIGVDIELLNIARGTFVQSFFPLYYSVIIRRW